jgi:hypothetical protein
LPKKIFICILWIEGVLAIAHGMTQNNDTVFIVGILSVTIAYLMLRKYLKRSGEKPIENEPGNSESHDEE